MNNNMLHTMHENLRHECTHMYFYLQSAALVEGIERNHLKPFFTTLAASEMNHVQEFADFIVGLGSKDISLRPFDIPLLCTPKEILTHALNLEREVVERYYNQIKIFEKVDGLDERWAIIFLEEQLEDSRKDLDNLYEMLR